MSSTRSRTLQRTLALVATVATVFTLAYLDHRREQARALDDFVAEQSLLARAVGQAMSARLELVARDLSAAAALDDGNAALEHLLSREGSPYIEAEVLDSDGAPVVERVKDGATPTSDLAAARRALPARLARSTGLVSSALTAGTRLRLFALRRGPRTWVLVADLDRLFADMQSSLRTVGTPLRWLVLDETGRDVDVGTGGAPPPSAELAALFADMQHGGSGASILSREAADALGLGHRLAVAGFAPVALALARPWSIAVVASARRVRDRARLTAWRLGITTALASLLVALFGVLSGRQQRREQRLAEALNLAEATAALRERSEKMIEVIPIGVLALDAKQHVVSANPYLMERGVRPGGALSEALESASADEIAILRALLAEALETRRASERAGLLLHFTKGGRRDVDVYAIPLGRPLPDLDCFLVLHDRTEMRSLERNLVRAEKLATIGTLAAGVAHEVGTPLGIISGRAEQLLLRVPDGDEGEPMRKNVASILAQVDKVGTTIRQLLDFARVRPIAREAVTPAQALGSAAALLQPRFRQAGVSLDLDVKPTVAPVAADPGQLEQVLVNLMINACDACTPGGRVWARATALPDRVAIEICDDGVGIAKEHLSMVLDPFFTTKKRGQGTGLGLTIVADIVRNHGGSLEIESEVGRGTTMRVLLPKAATEVVS